MYELVVHAHFSSAHRLRGYRGKCEELHGHNWKVAVRLAADTLDNLGMVIDFTVVKQKLNKIMQKLDHTYLNELPPFDSLNPSSENLSFYVFHELKKKINNDRISLKAVTVWESEDSLTTYSES